jgi:PEP-CTERM motif-containing protein
MKKYITFTCIVACLFFAAAQSKASPDCTAVAGNLVANCGFETGDFTDWTLSGNDVPGELNNLYGVEGVDPVDGISPHSGSYQTYIADLDPNATTLAQTIATTSGDQYTITFWVAQDTAPSDEYGNELLASFGGTSLVDDSDVAVEGYTEYSYAVDATSATSELDLTLGNDLGEFLLDDVSVVDTTPVVTPEPGSLLLFGTGLLALAGVARRRLSSR